MLTNLETFTEKLLQIVLWAARTRAEAEAAATAQLRPAANLAGKDASSHAGGNQGYINSSGCESPVPAAQQIFDPQSPGCDPSLRQTAFRE